MNANVAPSVDPDTSRFASSTEALSSEEEARLARFTFIDAGFDDFDAPSAPLNAHDSAGKMEDTGAAIDFEGELAKKGSGFTDRWDDRCAPRL